MLNEEMIAYLKERHVATLVTLNQDGSPHTAPVWYEYKNGKLYVIAESSSVKVRNVERDPRVAVSIANDDSPAKYVLVEGNARVSTDDVEQARLEMYVRYQGQERGARTVADTAERGTRMTVVIVEPTKILAWSSEDEA